MNTQVAGTAHGKAGSSFGRLLILIGGGIVLVLALATPLPHKQTQEVLPIASLEPVARRTVKPGQARVLVYLRSQLSVRQPTTDAAQQGVVSYLRAHGVVATSPSTALPWEPAVRAVFDYLEAHGW